MYAVIKTGGKQYKVSEGDTIYVEKLGLPEGKTVDFTVISGCNDNGFFIGNSLSDSAKVIGKILKNGKSHKTVVFTYKPKKSCKCKMGHRQMYSKVQIEKISF